MKREMKVVRFVLEKVFYPSHETDPQGQYLSSFATVHKTQLPNTKRESLAELFHISNNIHVRYIYYVYCVSVEKSKIFSKTHLFKLFFSTLSNSPCTSQEVVCTEKANVVNQFESQTGWSEQHQA
ncbi:unnamed protein product [Orchesella dallaii]|uniref:Uncharacterized protein n=1 Tax=Orchesella dallaii TaxID=48710 RepID=A0ABP1RXL5_9HEXA